MPSLSDLLAEYAVLTEQLSHPDRIAPGEFATIAARHAELQPLMEAHSRMASLKQRINESTDLATDADPGVQALAAEELPSLQEELNSTEAHLRRLLLPKDPHANSDIIMEIRGGAGGDEASLFARDLFAMYAKFAERRGWTVSIVSESRTEAGGYKELIAELSGTSVYAAMKFESGVHRIQRIPDTEKMGRVHTSTATVAVLPKAEETDMEIRPQDIRVDTFRAGGHGGQGVQKTESAVRITHLPSGLIVQCQDERSQQKNRERAMGVLRTRLLALQTEQQAKTNTSVRRAQIGTGDRSEKIRTYNIPQSRITDHRIKKSWHDIARIFSGDLGEVIGTLQHAEEEALLSSEQ